MNMDSFTCTNCGSITNKPLTRGSGLIEIVLYLFAAIIGGVIYSIWRRKGRASVCPTCKKDTLIPTPVAAQQSDSTATVKCAWCAETIKAEAKICRFCNKPVEPKYHSDAKSNKQIIAIEKLTNKGHSPKQIADFLNSKKQTFLTESSEWTEDRVRKVIEHHLSGKKSGQTQAAQKNPVKAKKKRSSLVPVALGLLVFAAVGNYLSSSSKPRPTVNKQVQQPVKPIDVGSSSQSVSTSQKYSAECKQTAANKWLIDFTMEHGKTTQNQKLKFIQQVATFSEGIRKLCGDNGLNFEILQSAKKKIKPKWIEPELNDLINQALKKGG